MIVQCLSLVILALCRNVELNTEYIFLDFEGFVVEVRCIGEDVLKKSETFFFEFLIRYPGSAPMSRGTQRAQTNPDPHREPPLKGKVLAKG